MVDAMMLRNKKLDIADPNKLGDCIIDIEKLCASCGVKDISFT